MFESSVDVKGVVARVRDAAAALAVDSRACAAWSRADRSAALACVQAAEAALAEARAHLLVAARSTGELERPGDRSFDVALARSTRAGSTEATRQVRQADTLVSMTSVAAGVRDGLVPLGHLDTIARLTATAAPEVAAELRSAESQEVVVQMARSLSAPDFAKSLARYVASKDPAALESAFEAQRRERFLTLSIQAHGAFLKGRLDVIDAEKLRIALDLMGQHPDADRTAGQASADALALMAERVCAGTSAIGVGREPAGRGGRDSQGIVGGDREASEGDDREGGGGGRDRTSGGGRDRLDGGGSDLGAGRGGEMPTTATTGNISRPHLSLIVPAETFVELIRHQAVVDATVANPTGDQLVPDLTPRTPSSARDRDRVAPVVTPPWSSAAPWIPVPPATLVDGTPVPMSELGRALCDADISRIVVSAEGAPLDVGRTRRLFTPAMRRAAVARDQQCIWNDCTVPVSRCEMHHLRWWDKHHGATSLANAGLICGGHHRRVHQLELTVERLAQPPGWVTRQQAEGRPINPTTSGIAGQPMRYVFRDPTGRVVNMPEGWPDSS